jgi:hypothetical protein
MPSGRSGFTFCCSMRLSISSTASATFHNPHFHSPDFDRFISVLSHVHRRFLFFITLYREWRVWRVWRVWKVGHGKLRHFYGGWPRTASEDGPRAHGVFEHYADGQSLFASLSERRRRQRNGKMPRKRCCRSRRDTSATYWRKVQ